MSQNYTITLPRPVWQSLVAALGDAVAHSAAPSDWRPSEYVVCKALARDIHGRVRLWSLSARPGDDSLTLSLIEWSVAAGELARYVAGNGPRRAVALESYRALAQALSDSRVTRLLAVESSERAQARTVAELADALRRERSTLADLTRERDEIIRSML